MNRAIALSKTKLLTHATCARRLWLAQYRPELAQDVSAATYQRLATGLSIGAIARRLYGGGSGHWVSFDGGVAAALEQTRELLAAGGTAPIFEATFDHDGLVVRVDVLDRSRGAFSLVEVKSATRVKPEHLADCAIQAWTLRELDVPIERVAVAHVNAAFVYEGGGDYANLLVEEDVTEAIAEHVAAVPELVRQARATLTGVAEPNVAIGVHCGAPFDCAFYAHCAPPQAEHSVWALGGAREQRFALLRDGFTDLRDVPDERLTNDLQRRIQHHTKLGTPFVDDALRELCRTLPYPRYYLDFETISLAVPRWAGTRPYEQVPFQWSCHIQRGANDLAHAEFLDLSGDAPLRACAEQLVATLGRTGPILVYTPFEDTVLQNLADRCADLAPALQAIRARLVDLHRPVREHYYHPRMHGSWSIKSVVPTVAAELSYERLGTVRDGGAAQAAYLQAIDPATPAERRAELARELREYCGHDTWSMVRLVAFFAGPR
jgi:hypothetical protein